MGILLIRLYIKVYMNVTESQKLITNERLVQVGYYSILAQCESLQLCD